MTLIERKQVAEHFSHRIALGDVDSDSNLDRNGDKYFIFMPTPADKVMFPILAETFELRIFPRANKLARIARISL